MSIYIQIGAGAGDQEKGNQNIDGFTKFIKSTKITNEDKILIVEANAMNIETLKKCWKNFSNVKIFNLAITGDNNKLNQIELYYTEDDFPFYQITSNNYEHVRKHYPKSQIKKFLVNSKKISEFLSEEVNSNKVEYLAIDIEGMDVEVLMSINFKKYNIQNISTEFLHLQKNNRKKLLHKLANEGYSFKGLGFDVNGYDFMFEKKN